MSRWPQNSMASRSRWPGASRGTMSGVAVTAAAYLAAGLTAFRILERITKARGAAVLKMIRGAG
jgi:hypothetical protein